MKQNFGAIKSVLLFNLLTFWQVTDAFKVHVPTFLLRPDVHFSQKYLYIEQKHPVAWPRHLKRGLITSHNKQSKSVHCLKHSQFFFK